MGCLNGFPVSNHRLLVIDREGLLVKFEEDIEKRHTGLAFVIP